MDTMLQTRPAGAGVALLLLGGFAVQPARAQSADTPTWRSFNVRYLDVREAEILIWDVCAEIDEDECDVRSSGESRRGGGTLQVFGDRATQERAARMLADRDVAPPTTPFQIILVRGSRDGSGMPADLSENARRALEDITGFLPFTRFAVLDTAWLRTSERARVSLSGPDGERWDAELSVRQPSAGQLLIDRFELDTPLPPGAPTPPAAPSPPAAAPAAPGPAGRPGRPAPAAETPREAPPAPAFSRSRSLLSTSFAMKSGETVVVGTSAIAGSSEAVIVLLTALPAR
jgi:hypothetical protein